MQPWNIAHRGGAALSPENTLTAFGRAQRLGVDGVELDVQLSADGQVVVHHDYRLNPGYTRLRNGDWLGDVTPRIKDLTLEQLHRYNIGLPRPCSDYARKHPLLRDADGEGIPTLETAVRISKIYPRFEMMVELKCDTSDDSSDPLVLADAVYDVVAAADFLPNTIFVGFDWRALARIRQRAPTASCWFTTDKLSGDARPIIDAIAQAGGQGWFPYFPDATPDNVAHARTRGLKVGAWTVNDPADMCRLMGLDAICTDRPDLLAALG
jgi:glycerophosphoryl diester phosphodiesterase